MAHHFPAPAGACMEAASVAGSRRSASVAASEAFHCMLAPSSANAGHFPEAVVVPVVALDGALASALSVHLEAGGGRAAPPRSATTLPLGGSVQLAGGLGSAEHAALFGGQLNAAAMNGQLDAVANGYSHGVGWGNVAGSSSTGGPAQVQPDQAPNFHHVNAFEAIASGRAFLKQFDDMFIDRLDCPSGFGYHLLHELVPAIRIRGATPLFYEVGVHVTGNQVRFTEGWRSFVESEKLVRGDYGLFVLSSPHSMEMRVFDRSGNFKPMSSRPAVWDFLVAHGQDPVLQGEAVAQMEVDDFAVPEHLLGMQYELGPRLVMNGTLMQSLSDVWINFETDFPLYACKLTNSHVNGPSFYFATTFSSTLNMLPRRVILSFNADDEVFEAQMRMRRNGTIAVMNRGWSRFVGHYGFHTGDILIFSMRMYMGSILCRVFRLPLV